MSKIYSNILKSIALPMADKAMGTSVASFLKQLKQMQNYSKEEIVKWQNSMLRKLIDHAYNNTDYYNTVFKKYGIGTKDIQSIGDLNKLPKLTKNDIRQNFKSLVPTNIDSISYKKASTGGSTGEPLSYFLDLNSWSFVNASKIYNWEKAGYAYGEKHIALGSTSLFIDKKVPLKHRLYYGMKNKIGLNGVNMSSEVCERYIEIIKKRKVRYIYGYASSIYLLAKFVKNKNIDVSIDICFSTSEVLTQLFRETILEVFNCKIVDCYGAHDGGLTAFAHEESYFEVTYNSLLIQENQVENDLSPLLVTDLFNFSMPLINYDLGDVVSIWEGDKNRYNGQALKQVGGRTSEIIVLENGNTITGPGFTILFKDIPVEYYQIRKSGVNSIECSIKALPQFTDKHTKIIEETFKKNLGSGVQFKLIFTDRFEFSKSGKLKYFDS